MRILFSNIGYAKDINGALLQHICRISRHFFCPPSVQQRVLSQMKAIIQAEKPELCCFVEIDKGSFHSAYYNQLGTLLDQEYAFFDIANKYGANSLLSYMPLHHGRSNAFLSNIPLSFERLYFTHGTKRLIYRLHLPGNIHLFFAHFSLNRKVRQEQFKEIYQLVSACPGEVILMADFNIMHGISELQPLLHETHLRLLNRDTEPTFTFSKRRLLLDLCICSETIARNASLRIIPQPFSDHAALLLEV